MLLDTARNEQTSKLEELNEQLAKATHEKKLQSFRLQSLSHGYEQELKKANEKLQKERTRPGREQVRDCTEIILGGIRREIEECLALTPILTKEEQQRLQSTDLSLLSIGDYVRVGCWVCGCGCVIADDIVLKDFSFNIIS